MTGPDGYDPGGTANQRKQRFVKADGLLDYRIEIRNVATAETAAKLVTGRDVLVNPDMFDLSTIEFMRIGFGQWEQVLGGVHEFSTRVELGPDVGYVVDVTASVDVEDADGDGNIKWEFRSIDPSTGEAPEDRLAGVLPPYDETNPTDIAWFEFRVKPQAGLPTGTRMENRSYGEFDGRGDWQLHAAPESGPWTNTIDAGAPLSQVEALPPSSPEMFEVRWTGEDDENGSGVATFDVYVSEGDQPLALWLDDTADTSSVYQGQPGRTYRFYSVASDHVGNVEPSPATADAVTRVIVEDEKWRNPDNALDVNADGSVSPIDALLIINHLNENPGDSSLPAPPAVPPPFLDVSGDLLVSPLDALLVINFLNATAGSGAASAAGEPDGAYDDQAGGAGAVLSFGVSGPNTVQSELDSHEIAGSFFQQSDALSERVSVASAPVPSRGSAVMGTGVIVVQASRDVQRIPAIHADARWQLNSEFEDVIARSV